MCRFKELLRHAVDVVVGKLVGQDPDPRYSRLDAGDGLGHDRADVRDRTTRRSEEPDDSADAA